MTGIHRHLTSAVRYEGPANESLLGNMQHSIDAAFQGYGEPVRARLFEVMVELAQNAWRYGKGVPSYGSLTVGDDANGAYVETASIASPDDAGKITMAAERLAIMSDIEIEDAEERVMFDNLGTQRSGLGLMQVFRRAIWRDGRRQVEVSTEHLGPDVKLIIRAYISPPAASS